MVENEEGRAKEKEKGYEALIKPIQDVIAKDWKVRLCNYLDIYIEHIHEPGTVFINFTEAALLVQNTSTYYCKRVDLMYNWVRQFCFSLAEKFLEATDEGETSQEKTTESKTTQKKTKKKNQLHSDELESIPLSHTESKTINFKLEKIDKSLIKKVVLNSCMKTQTKPATCIPVQQSVTEEMGFKDEFRLHWKMAYDGLLHEDFRYDLSQGGIAADMENADHPGDCLLQHNEASDDDDHDAGDIGMDTNYDNDMDIEAVPPLNPELSGSVPLNTDMPEHRASEGLGLMPDNPPQEVSDVPDKVPNKQEENFFTVIPFASLIMHRKFKKRQVFKLPKELIEEVSESRKKQKKNGKTDEDGKLKDNDSDYNYHLSFSEILGGKSEDMIQHKLGKRKSANLSKRKKRAQKQCPENNNVENAADLNNDTAEDDDHDFADLADDLADHSETETGGALGGEQNENFEDAYEASAQLYSEIMKTKNDPLSITKRVAAWHNMIQPVLEKAEARSVFSVNEYGTRILEKFNEAGEIRPFAEVVAGQPKEEICRYFLSTLMLANTYNLEIQKTSNEELSKDCLQMKLLSKVRHHEELDANVGATTANGPML